MRRCSFCSVKQANVTSRSHHCPLLNERYCSFSYVTLAEVITAIGPPHLTGLSVPAICPASYVLPVMKSETGLFPANRDYPPEAGLGDVEGVKIITTKATVGQSPILYGNL